MLPCMRFRLSHCPKKTTDDGFFTIETVKGQVRSIDVLDDFRDVKVSGVIKVVGVGHCDDCGL